MTLDEFRATLQDQEPPAVAPLLIALWHDARGDWSRAHEVAQDVGDADGAWVHAYLHRKEGDASNARYWYRRAGKPAARESLDAEWEEIARLLLAERPMVEEIRTLRERSSVLTTEAEIDRFKNTGRR